VGRVFNSRTLPAPPKAKAKQARAPKRGSPEHDIQVAFFKRVNTHPATKRLLIYAVPNGGHRDIRTASRLKAEGVRKGVPDVQVDEACGPYHGLRIEFKAGKNTLSPEQTAWLHALNTRGYATAVCYSTDDAWAVLMRYLLHE